MPLFKRPVDFHSSLMGAGFTYAGSEPRGATGSFVTHRYVMPGQFGLKPLNHHIDVNVEKGSKNHDASYYVRHRGSSDPFLGGDLDKNFRSVGNTGGHGVGSYDSISDLMDHHKEVTDFMNRWGKAKLTPVNVGNAAGLGLVPERFNQDYSQRMSSAPGDIPLPLDSNVARWMKGAGFRHLGRLFEGEPVDHYQLVRQDPYSPHTFEYVFNVRNSPEKIVPLSYNVFRRQSGVGYDGEKEAGSPTDVRGDLYPVVKFDTPKQLVDHHNDYVNDVWKKRKTSSSDLGSILMDQADDDLRP